MIKSFLSSSIEANSYLVFDTKVAVLFDCGISFNKIQKFILENNLNLRAIVLTHGHFDHFMGLVNQEVKVPIYLHYLDNKLLSDSTKNCSSYFLNQDLVLKDKTIINFDNDELDFDGLNFKVLHTPFHTMGSCCFIKEDENILLSGDTLFKNSIGRSDFSTSNQDLIVPSLTKIKKLKKNYKIFPGHGEITTLEDELKNNVFLKYKVDN